MTDIVEQSRDPLDFLEYTGREGAARIEITSLRQQLATAIEAHDEWVSLANQQLAECQAREKVLRDALEYWDDLISYQFTGSSEAMTAMQIATDKGAAALYLQQDSTALDTMKKQWQREALLEAAESFTCKTYGLAPHDLRNMAKEMK